MTHDILSQIPGEILGAAGYALPAAETSTEGSQRVIVDLPDGRRAEVTYVKLKSKKGKTTRWFCTPQSAVLVQKETMEPPPEDWQPTPENINALPEPVRRYIVRLETMADPAGLVRENVLLKEQIAALMKKQADRK